MLVYGHHLVVSTDDTQLSAEGDMAQIADDFSVEAGISQGQAIAALNRLYLGSAATGKRTYSLLS